MKKAPMAPAQLGAAIGLPPGKKFSVKNLAKLKRPRGGKTAPAIGGQVC